jgi:putative iron-regulated protein
MLKFYDFRKGLAVAGAALLFAAPVIAAPEKAGVLDTYADIAEAAYADSLTTAQTLETKVDEFLASPGDETLAAAKEAWLAARAPYQQTEVYRFGNAIVDDWEGKVNAWPLDEGLIDYVDASYGGSSELNDLYTANVIANESLTVAGKQVDASSITKALISETLHEAGQIEANVATGYHVIEFLLWGQDLNGTGEGKGTRPATDYDKANCTGGNCERRAAYLRVATELLVDELTWMADQWKDGGKARTDLLANEDAGIVAMFTGMGSLSYGELAGERMKLGLLLNDPEEEHDCFSDNTHNSHYYDVLGIRNVYLGSYERVDGSAVSGPSLSELVKAAALETDEALRKQLDETLAKFKALKDRAESVEAYDQMIGESNDEGNAIVQAAIDSLLDQTKAIERAVATLKLDAIQFEGSDSLDNPTAVFAQ